MGLTNYVDYSTAKLLKEKGFDSKKCIGYYTKEGEFFYFDVDDISSSYNSRLDNLIVNSIDPLYCLAPTILEVVMWLYDKHGIWIEVYIDDDKTFGYLISKFKKENRIDCPLNRKFKSPTETYTIAIKHCLLTNLLNLG